MNFGNRGYLVVAGLRQKGERLPSAKIEASRMDEDVFWSDGPMESS